MTLLAVRRAAHCRRAAGPLLHPLLAHVGLVQLVAQRGEGARQQRLRLGRVDDVCGVDTLRLLLAALAAAAASAAAAVPAPRDERAHAARRRLEEGRQPAASRHEVHRVARERGRHPRQPDYLEASGQRRRLHVEEAVGGDLHRRAHRRAHTVAARDEVEAGGAAARLGGDAALDDVDGGDARAKNELEPARRLVPFLELVQQRRAEGRLVDEHARLLRRVGPAQVEGRAKRQVQREAVAAEALLGDGLPEGLVGGADGRAASEAKPEGVGAAFWRAVHARVLPVLVEPDGAASFEQLVREEEARRPATHDRRVEAGEPGGAGRCSENDEERSSRHRPRRRSFAMSSSDCMKGYAYCIQKGYPHSPRALWAAAAADGLRRIISSLAGVVRIAGANSILHSARMILSDVLTCTVPPLRVESSLLKNPIPPKNIEPRRVPSAARCELDIFILLE